METNKNLPNQFIPIKKVFNPKKTNRDTQLRQGVLQFFETNEKPTINGVLKGFKIKKKSENSKEELPEKISPRINDGLEVISQKPIMNQKLVVPKHNRKLLTRESHWVKIY
jgi:hypothetical protein